MTTFIQCTDASGRSSPRTLYINLDDVSAMWWVQSEGHTMIHMRGHGTFMVKETPEEIFHVAVKK